jgi:hypothetical protein
LTQENAASQASGPLQKGTTIDVIHDYLTMFLNNINRTLPGVHRILHPFLVDAGQEIL